MATKLALMNNKIMHKMFNRFPRATGNGAVIAKLDLAY